MFVFKVSTLFALIYTSFSLPAEQAGSGSTVLRDGDLNYDSVVDYPVTVPKKVLKELLDISDKSKGLLLLWRNSFYLTKDSLLKAEVR